ncbi:MAG: biopolymer transporter ExbD [Thiovulaceae bacterium]|nr:biopolymer transporter ExbD [Sulfurimonadaceae bacterium]
MKLRRVDSINVIPFIDIMLVLLVIVLTTATFIKEKNFPVDLPQSSQGKAKTDTKAKTLTVKQDGTYIFDNKEISLIDLKVTLKKLGSKQPIELYSDKKTPFEYFVKVMELLKSIDHKELFIVTRE